MRALLLLAAVLCALPASAEDELDRKFELGAFGGAYGTSSKIAINGESDIADGGGIFGLRFMANVNKAFGVGVQLAAIGGKEKQSTTLVTAADSTTKWQSTELLALMRARFGAGRWRPYLLGGLGMHASELKVDATPRAGFVWANTGTREKRNILDGKGDGAAVMLELGFDYHFSTSFSAGVLAGWHYQGSADFGNGVKGRASGLALGVSATARF